MKVILKADVNDRGKKGDVITVKDGYARNFLFPRGLAVEANAQNMNNAAARKKVAAHKKEMETQTAKELAKQFAQVSVTLKAKCGTTGRLFGAVTAAEVAAAVEETMGVEVDKKKIVMSPIKELGVYTLAVKLYPGVQATLKVIVEA